MLYFNKYWHFKTSYFEYCQFSIECVLYKNYKLQKEEVKKLEFYFLIED